MKGSEQNTLVDQVPSVILDMYSSSIATTPANEEDDDDRLVIDAETIQAIQKALETARRLETIEVLTSRKRGDRFYKVTTRATIEAVKETRTQSRYSEVVIKLMPPHDDTIMTMLTVSFGRDRSTHWITLQGNPTSTLTGQNIWPMEHTFKTAYRQKAMMLAWPYLTLLAVCRAADRKFKAPLSLMKRVMRGETTCQNLQIASYLSVPATDKTSFCALVGAGFRTPRVRARPDGTLEAFDLGQRLGIDAVPYPPAQSEDGLAPWASMMLRKRSGNNEFGTLTFYDKAAEQSMTATQAKKQGLSNLIRVDITLKKRGLEYLFSAAKKLADKHEEILDLAVNANKKSIASAANVVKAIDVLDKHFAVTIQEHESKGFHAWLITEIVHRKFYLRELLGYTPKKWRHVEQWMAKWAAKNDRYKSAFDQWRQVSTSDTTLYDCITNTGLSGDTAAARIKELNELGFSGEIPPLYWTNRRTMARSWGSTDAEEVEYWRLSDAGKPTAELDQLWRQRVDAGFKVCRLAINSIHEIKSLRTVPIAGVIEPVEPTAAPSKTSKVAAKPEMTDTKAAGSKLKPIGKGSKGGSEKPTPKAKTKVADKPYPVGSWLRKRYLDQLGD